jgi:hypothetical protein
MTQIAGVTLAGVLLIVSIYFLNKINQKPKLS